MRALIGAAIVALACAACGDKKEAPKTPAAKKAKTEAAVNLPNYRYVDIDTVLSRYALAKDYNEEMIRMQTNMENALKKHQANIQNKAQTMQNKMQNNSYLSRESYDQDEKALNNMQASAQREAQSLQANFENAAMKAQKAVNDSIEAYIKHYNESHGYDAIFFKNATLYINPALDITDEIVEGLNARYNKVKKN